MVAELIILKRALETRKKALIILPYVSVAREKMLQLQVCSNDVFWSMCVQRLFRRCGVRVEGYMGNFAPTLPFERWDVAVCTLEKANNMLNSFIEDGLLDALGMYAHAHTSCRLAQGQSSWTNCTL
jgi:DNA polymerase theta